MMRDMLRAMWRQLAFLVTPVVMPLLTLELWKQYNSDDGLSAKDQDNLDSALDALYEYQANHGVLYHFLNDIIIIIEKAHTKHLSPLIKSFGIPHNVGPHAKQWGLARSAYMKDIQDQLSIYKRQHLGQADQELTKENHIVLKDLVNKFRWLKINLLSASYDLPILDTQLPLLSLPWILELDSLLGEVDHWIGEVSWFGFHS